MSYLLELSFVNENGSKILTLTTLEEVKQLFIKVDCSNVENLMIELLSKHFRFELDGELYYHSNYTMDNNTNRITILYTKL